MHPSDDDETASARIDSVNKRNTHIVEEHPEDRVDSGRTSDHRGAGMITDTTAGFATLGRYRAS